MKKELTCIICPRGCTLQVEINGDQVNVTYEVNTNQVETPDMTIYLGTAVTAYAAGGMEL